MHVSPSSRIHNHQAKQTSQQWISGRVGCMIVLAPSQKRTKYSCCTRHHIWRVTSQYMFYPKLGNNVKYQGVNNHFGGSLIYCRKLDFTEQADSYGWKSFSPLHLVWLKFLSILLENALNLWSNSMSRQLPGCVTKQLTQTPKLASSHQHSRSIQDSHWYSVFDPKCTFSDGNKHLCNLIFLIQRGKQLSAVTSSLL